MESGGPISTDFLEPGALSDGDLHLALKERCAADPERSWVPAYRFEMRRSETAVGWIDLRLGVTEFLVRFAGQVAYHVYEEHRGRRYAARALRLLLPLARRHGFAELWITCNPENAASRRTCELAGAEFVEIVDLPSDCEMYEEGEREKCRYRLVVSE